VSFPKGSWDRDNVKNLLSTDFKGKGKDAKNYRRAHLMSPCRKATAIRCARLSAPNFWHAR
jgi:hypothetical protein